MTKLDMSAVDALFPPPPAPPATLTMYIDGLCEPVNPGGYACWAWLAFAPDGAEIGNGWDCLGHSDNSMTNNLAEYAALLNALLWLEKQDLRGAAIYSDSQLVVNQVTGAWECRAPGLRYLHARCVSLLACQASTLHWIPREQNEQADALTRHAYRVARGIAR